MHTLALPLAFIGWHEGLIALLVLLLLFGASKLPELARAMGSSIQQFKKGLKEGEDEPRDLLEKGTSEPPKDRS